MQNKKAIVSGASRGIGLAISQSLLQMGYHVVGLARNFSSCPLNQSSSFTSYEVDLSKVAQLPKFFKQLSKEHSDTQTIICNAGQGLFGHLEQYSCDSIRSTMDLNFLSHAYLAREFLPLLKKKEQAFLIMIGSEAALAGKKRGSIYCASKFALRGFAQALREECASSSVQVSLIHPGMTKTDFFQDLDFSPGSSPLEHLTSEDVSQTVCNILESRPGCLYEEISISPQKKVFKPQKKKFT